MSRRATRARAGLFLSFQSPVEVPGVSNVDFLRLATNERRKARGEGGKGIAACFAAAGKGGERSE